MGVQVSELRSRHNLRQSITEEEMLKLKMLWKRSRFDKNLYYYREKRKRVYCLPSWILVHIFRFWPQNKAVRNVLDRNR